MPWSVPFWIQSENPSGSIDLAVNGTWYDIYDTNGDQHSSLGTAIEVHAVWFETSNNGNLEFRLIADGNTSLPLFSRALSFNGGATFDWNDDQNNAVSDIDDATAPLLTEYSPRLWRARIKSEIVTPQRRLQAQCRKTSEASRTIEKWRVKLEVR